MFDNSALVVRQLCQKLQPVLGPGIEKVYLAWQAEDENGKELLEKYLQRLAFKYLPNDLSSSEFDLLPPTQKQAAGEYELGTVIYGQKQLYPFGLREDEWIQHVAILGRSGAGKTNTGFLVLKTLKKHNKPFLLFDWKRNYRDLLSLKEFKNVEIYTIGRNIAPFSFNPLIPPQGTDSRTWLKKLNEVIAHAYCLGNGVLYLLQRAVDEVYDQAGVYDGTVQQWPTFKDVLLKAQKMDARGRESGWLSSTLRALSSLCFGDMDKLLNTNSNQSLDRILENDVILELDALTQSDKVFFIESLLLWIHHKRMTEQRRETFKHSILIEEAHHVLSDERRSLVGGQSVMEIIFREIREFGESLILLDQHPSKISLPALGNTYTTLSMNLKHKSDVNAMGQCMLMDKERDLLGTLEVGQAVVKLQGRSPRPFLIQIPHLQIQKGAVTDEDVGRHMSQIAPAWPSEDFRLGGAQPVKHHQPLDMPAEKTAPDFQQAFVMDILKQPDSGIAQRYKRLGISVRQGQKIKDRLCREKWIQESEEITAMGRKKILSLLPKAQEFLSIPSD